MPDDFVTIVQVILIGLASFAIYKISVMASVRSEEELEHQIMENIENMDTIPVPPHLDIEDDFQLDADNPLNVTADTVTSEILGESRPTMPPPPTNPEFKGYRSQADIKRLTIKVSSNLGTTFDLAHLEDLYHLANRFSIGLSEREIFMYMRGVMRTHQISATAGLSKITNSLEGALAKTQQQLLQGSDSNKLLIEKISSLSIRVDDILPAITTLIRGEISKLLAALSGKGKAIDVDVPSSSTPPSTPIPTHPGTEEIKAMYLAAGFTLDQCSPHLNKYAGSITWDEYRKVVSGSLSKSQILTLLDDWKYKYGGKARPQ